MQPPPAAMAVDTDREPVLGPGGLRTPRPRALLALVAALAVLVVVATLTWRAFPVPFLAVARAGTHLGLLALLCGTFAGWGTLLARLLRLDRASLVVRAALGAAATATVCGYLAPWWFPDALFAVPWLLAGCGLLLLDVGGALVSSPPASAPPAEASRPPAGARLLWGAALVFLQPPLLVALAPPIAIDSLIYHLAIPHQAALLGRLGDMPWLQYSYFPLHAEMLYGLGLALDGGVLAQLLHLSAAVAAVATAARIAARCWGPAAAPWTALLLASVPMLNLIAGAAGNDWFVALYVALALEQHLRAEKEPAARYAEALFLGAAAATKYTALPALVLLLLPWRQRSWRRLLQQGAIVLLVALPWYGRNLLLHHNPVYPLLSSSPVAASLADFRGGGSLPARLRGYLFEPALADESPGLLLPAAAALAAVMIPGRRKTSGAPSLLLVVYALPVLFTHPTARSFVPLLLVLAILGGGAAALLASTATARRILSAVALAVLPFQLISILAVWELDGHQPLRVVAGLEDEEAYLRRSQPYIDAFGAVSRRAPAAARVLLVGEGRAFYLDRPAIYGSIVDPHPLAAFAGEPPDGARAARRLVAAGVRLIYFYPPQQRAGRRPPGIRHELDFYAPPELDKALHQLLAEHAHPVFRHRNAWIFVLGQPQRGSAAPRGPTGSPK